MVNNKNNPVAWAAFSYELEDAKEHLEALINQLNIEGSMDESDFAVQLAHIYSHLNRSWSMRNVSRELSQEDWEHISKFPMDLSPI